MLVLVLCSLLAFHGPLAARDVNVFSWNEERPPTPIIAPPVVRTSWDAHVPLLSDTKDGAKFFSSAFLPSCKAPSPLAGGVVVPVRQVACPSHRAADAVNASLVVVTHLRDESDGTLVLFLSALHTQIQEDSHASLIVTVADTLSRDAEESACRTSWLLYPRLTVSFYVYSTANVPLSVRLPDLHVALLPALLPDSLKFATFLDIRALVVGDIRGLLDGNLCGPHGNSAASIQRSSAFVCARPLSIRDSVAPSGQGKSSCLSEMSRNGLTTSVMHVNLEQLRRIEFGSLAFSLSASLDMTAAETLALAMKENNLRILPSDFGVIGESNLRWSAGPKVILPSALEYLRPWHAPAYWEYAAAADASSGIIFVWAYTVYAFPRTAAQTVRAVALESGRPVTVVCASAACLDAITGLGIATVRAVPLRLRQFIDAPDAPLKRWFAEHAINKIQSGRNYPHYLQRAVELAALHHYGGLLLSFDVVINGLLPAGLTDSRAAPWCVSRGINGLGRAMFAPRHNEQIAALAARFANEFPSYRFGDRWPVRLGSFWDDSCYGLGDAGHAGASYVSVVQDAHNPIGASFLYAATADNDIDDGPAAQSKVLPTHLSDGRRPLFGIVWMDANTRNNGNIGDEVQGLASTQWLPAVDIHMDRDEMSAGPELNRTLNSLPPNAVTVIMNGWYGVMSMVWPPIKAIRPIPLAMYFSSYLFNKIVAAPNGLDWMDEHAPIGARDTLTQERFTSANVTTFFSACMTLTMQRHRVAKASECPILIVDVVEEVLRLLPPGVVESACMAKPEWLGPRSEQANGVARNEAAFRLLDRYSSAKVVLTSRLHAALPSAAMGATVVIYGAEKMPGGGKGMERFAGLLDFVHYVDISDAEAAQAKINAFDYFNPPPNPNADVLARQRCTIFSFIREHQPALWDSITMFDVDEIAVDC